MSSEPGVGPYLAGILQRDGYRDDRRAIDACIGKVLKRVSFLPGQELRPREDRLLLHFANGDVLTIVDNGPRADRLRSWMSIEPEVFHKTVGFRGAVLEGLEIVPIPVRPDGDKADVLRLLEIVTSEGTLPLLVMARYPALTIRPGGVDIRFELGKGAPYPDELSSGA